MLSFEEAIEFVKKKVNNDIIKFGFEHKNKFYFCIVPFDFNSGDYTACYAIVDKQNKNITFADMFVETFLKDPSIEESKKKAIIINN